MSSLVQIEELRELLLPSPLDGCEGSNRAAGDYSQIAAQTDVEAVRLWLAEYAGSPHTLRSYTKEALRLLVWCTGTLNKPLSSLNREDLLRYEAFLLNPPANWIDMALPRRGQQRRLLTGALSSRSVRQAMGILSGLFSYLVEAGYLAGNPLALRRRRREDKTNCYSVTERYLDQDLWQRVLEFIETLPRETQRERQHYERVRWLFRLLYGTGLRVSEAAKASSSDLMRRRGKWWLHVEGKGGVAGEVPVSENLMADLARYRQFYGLSPAPSSQESTPLIMTVSGNVTRSLTPTAVYLIAKEVFRRTAEALQTESPEDTAILRRASTHWLRHTAATHQADAGNDLRFIQKNLRHASIETTAIYLHAEDDKRHEMTTSENKSKMISV